VSHGTYRNRKLLDMIRESPECMHCGRYNDGTVVAAHSNQLRDGKGKSIKAHGLPCGSDVQYLPHGARPRQEP